MFVMHLLTEVARLRAQSPLLSMLTWHIVLSVLEISFLLNLTELDTVAIILLGSLNTIIILTIQAIIEWLVQ
jgi:hypothetical protein